MLTLLTNVLYNTMLTDMETCYKVMRTEVLRSMTLQSNGFGIEPELTAKIFKRGYRVYEVPITYDGRGYDEGKKITWRDGIVALWVLSEIPVHSSDSTPPTASATPAPTGGASPSRCVAMLFYARGVGRPRLADQADLRRGAADAGERSTLVAGRHRRSSYVLQGRRRVLLDLPDDRRRAARGPDLRNRLFRHILDQSAAFFARRTTGSADVAHHERRQPGPAGGVGDGRRPAARVARAGRLRGLLFYYDAKLALVCLTGAPLVVYPLVRLGQRVRRTTRRSQEELEHLSHVSAEAFTGHRIVKAFGAEAHEAGRFARASERLYRTNMKVTARCRCCRRSWSSSAASAWRARSGTASREIRSTRSS